MRRVAKDVNLGNLWILAVAGTLTVSCNGFVSTHDTVVVADPVAETSAAPVKTEHVMRGILGAHYWTMRDELNLKTLDENTWKTLEARSAVIHRSSYLLRYDHASGLAGDPGWSPDEVWTKAAAKLYESSGQLVRAIEKRDSGGAQRAFAAMTESCGSCHRECPSP